MGGFAAAHAGAVSRSFSSSKSKAISPSAKPFASRPFGVWRRRHPDRPSLALPDLPVPPARFREHREDVWTIHPEAWTYPAAAGRFSRTIAAVDGPYEPADGISTVAGFKLRPAARSSLQMAGTSGVTQDRSSVASHWFGRSLQQILVERVRE